MTTVQMKYPHCMALTASKYSLLYTPSTVYTGHIHIHNTFGEH